MPRYAIYADTVWVTNMTADTPEKALEIACQVDPACDTVQLVREDEDREIGARF